MSAVRRSTKAQIQLFETIAVVIVFSIFLIFGLYWFSQTAGEQIIDDRAQLENLELLELTKAIMNLPELQCSIEGRPDTSCVDELRAQTLSAQTSNPSSETYAYYRDRYDTNTRASYALTLIDVATQQQVTLFNFTNNQPGASRQSQAVPAVTYNPLQQTYNFSMLILTQEVTP